MRPRPSRRPPRDPIGERAISLALAGVFYRTIKPGLAIALVSALLSLAIFLPYVGPLLAWPWLGAVTLVLGAWLLVCLRRGRAEGVAAPLSPIHVVLAALLAALYAGAYAYLLHVADGFLKVIDAVFLFISTAGGTLIFTMTPAAAAAWALSGFLTSLVTFALTGEGLAFSLLGILAAFLAYVAFLAVSQYRVYRERFQSQATVEVQRAELEALFEQSPLSIVVTDLGGRILQVNARMEELSGYRKEELLGQNPRVLKSGLTPVERYVDLWATIRSGGTWYGEFTNRNKARGIYQEKASISPLLGADGRTRGYIAIKEDISARRAAEAEITRQKEIVSLLLHDFETQASDWLWELDEELRITYVSEKLTKLLGSTYLIGMTLLDFFRPLMPPGDAEALALLDRALEALDGAEGFKDLELKTWRNDRLRWISFSAMPLGGAVGRPRWRGVGRDITDRKLMELELERRAHLDERSGLPNRHWFKEELRRHLDEGDPGLEGILGIIRLDGLDLIRTNLGGKAYNDTVLAFAERFYAYLGRDWALSRLGGEEFVFWCPDQELANVEAIHGLAASLAQPLKVGPEAFQLDLHAGLAFFPEDGLDSNGLFHAADLALNGAIASGSRRVMRFHVQQAADLTRRLSLVHALPEALAAGQFRMVYQPQIEAASGRVVGAEALIRWAHPELGSVSPGEFIPLAEKSGFISRIGEWSLLQSCRDAMGWPGGIPVSVNVSGNQLRDAPRLRGLVREVLEETGLPPSRLTLEVTESAMFRLEGEVSRALLELQEEGIQVALDDFGTGYSSLTYLQRIRFNKLKIDQTFIRTLGRDAEAEKLVLVVLELAQAFTLWTVAEGVETPAQAEYLTRHGCDWLQGFLYGRGMSQDEFLAYVEGHGTAAS